MGQGLLLFFKKKKKNDCFSEQDSLEVPTTYEPVHKTVVAAQWLSDRVLK